ILRMADLSICSNLLWFLSLIDDYARTALLSGRKNSLRRALASLRELSGHRCSICPTRKKSLGAARHFDLKPLLLILDRSRFSVAARPSHPLPSHSEET